MNVKAIPSAWLSRAGRRFDCGPYTAGALEARIRLDLLACRKDNLVDVCADKEHGLVNAGRISRRWVTSPELGVPFLSSTSILRADISDVRLISKQAVRENPKLIIHAGYTLITRAGTIGRMCFARPNMSGMACTEDVLRVIPDPDKVHPGFLYAFLSSKFGVPIVTSGTYGAIIQHIEPEHIAALPVPRLGDEVEERAGRLMDESAGLVARYQSLVVAATEAFFESVGLKDISPAEWHKDGPDLGFSVQFPRHDSLRSLNFNPRFQRLAARVKAGPWRSLGAICIPGTLTRGGRFKRIDAAPEYSLRMVGQKHLFWLQPEGRWIAKFAMGKDVTVKPGTVLIAAQGTLGENELYSKAEFAWGPGVDLAYSEHILRAVADESVMLRGCLFAFLRSETAFRMFRSISVGSKLQDHHHVLRAEIPVPYPPRSVQEKVHNMVTEAYDCRHRGVALENEARALVERAIEAAT